MVIEVKKWNLGEKKVGCRMNFNSFIIIIVILILQLKNQSIKILSLDYLKYHRNTNYE